MSVHAAYRERGSYLVIILSIILTHSADAQEHTVRSRWSVSIRGGTLSNLNSEAVTLESTTDSVGRLYLGLKDAFAPAVAIEYDIAHDSGIGVSAGLEYGRANLDFGLVNLANNSAEHLADAQLHFISISLFFDIGDHGLYGLPEHNTFLLTTGVTFGRAWLSGIMPVHETQAGEGIAEIDSESESLIGVQSRVLWRVFNSAWVLSVGGSFLRGLGDTFLNITASPGGNYQSARASYSFALVNAGVSYRF